MPFAPTTRRYTHTCHTPLIVTYIQRTLPRVAVYLSKQAMFMFHLTISPHTILQKKSVNSKLDGQQLHSWRFRKAPRGLLSSPRALVLPLPVSWHSPMGAYSCQLSASDAHSRRRSAFFCPCCPRLRWDHGDSWGYSPPRCRGSLPHISKLWDRWLLS